MVEISKRGGLVIWEKFPKNVVFALSPYYYYFSQYMLTHRWLRCKMVWWFEQGKHQCTKKGAHTIWCWPSKIMSEVPDLADDIVEKI